jgi:hypothetical protein
MKLNSPRLIGQLCAASGVALSSAILIVGCATGEHTGKFWNKGDVNSDAYVAAEMARDQSFAANKTPAAGGNGKVATVSGTQDGTTGRVALPDFPDQPPPPLVPPVAVTVTSPKADAGRTAAGGAAVGSAQTATAVAGGAQAAGDVAAGSIVAPYVQKRAPSGALDNNRHDDEIVKTKSVFAKQLDPFAETDAEPFLAPPNATKRPMPAVARAVNPAPTLASAAPATTHATPPNGNPFAANDSAAPSAVSTKANATQTLTQPVSAPPAVAPSPPAAVVAPAASADAFDPSASPPVPISATSTMELVPTQSQPTAMPIATAAPGVNAVEAHKSAAVASPARRHVGVRLGDEDLNEDQQSPPHADQTQVVEPAATQVTAEAHPPVAASPYEADHAPACVATPPAPVKHPASATVPAAPSATQDSWESTKASKPRTPSNEPLAPISAPTRVTTRVFVPMELVPRRQAPVMPDAMVSAPIQTSTPAISEAPIKAVAERTRVIAPKVYVERPQASPGSDAMICDSVSVHGKYTGDDDAPLADARPKDLSHPATAAKSASPAAKKSPASMGGKTTSFWDDPFAASTPKHKVSTADFSVPAAPGPFDADDAPSSGLVAVSASVQSVSTSPARASARSRSRAWIVIGMVGGLAAIAVVWRLRRQHGKPQLG